MNNTQRKYEKSKLQWMLDHDYTLADLMRELTELQFADPEDSAQISMPVSELFAQWENDVGFGSEIWPCFKEWIDEQKVTIVIRNVNGDRITLTYDTWDDCSMKVCYDISDTEDIILTVCTGNTLVYNQTDSTDKISVEDLMWFFA